MRFPLPVLSAACLLLSATFVHAQEPIPGARGLQLLPLEDNRQLLQQHKSSRVCPATTALSLPFFDDFSRLDSLFPACARWVDHQAIIGSAIAYNPPTIGTATLDGLNEYAQPYNRLANPNIANPADTLTSQPIDLSSYTASSDVYISYYYQPQGLGDRPEVSDSLTLEFKNSSGEWLQMRQYAGLSNALFPATQSPDFVQDFLAISDTQFLHADFQFRFRNMGSITGNNDHWHIDYVYIDANRNMTGAISYPDVAFTHLPVSPLRRYTAMPFEHFRDTMLNDTLLMQTRNLGAISGTLDRLYTVEELHTATPLLSTPLPALTYSPSPNADDVLTGGFIGSFASYAPTDTATLLSTYTILNPTDFQNNPLFAHSDTVRRLTHLGNYFAYDDGVAEARIIAEQVGTQVAVEFHTTQDDTLRGVYFHLPYFINRDASQDFINVKVWLGDLNNEVFSRDIYRLRYTADFNGLHYMALTDFAGEPTPLYLPANTRFYVGWQQASTISVPVGFDKSNDASQYTFVHTGNTWTRSDLVGAIMIRPLVSMSTEFDIVGVERPSAAKPTTARFRLFPNPAPSADVDGFFLAQQSNGAEEEISRVEVYDALGRLCTVDEAPQMQSGAAYRVSVPTHLPAGWYAVRLMLRSGEMEVLRWRK